jgi:hypothetical protein
MESQVHKSKSVAAHPCKLDFAVTHMLFPYPSRQENINGEGDHQKRNQKLNYI